MKRLARQCKNARFNFQQIENNEYGFTALNNHVDRFAFKRIVSDDWKHLSNSMKSCTQVTKMQIVPGDTGFYLDFLRALLPVRLQYLESFSLFAELQDLESDTLLYMATETKNLKKICIVSYNRMDILRFPLFSVLIQIYSLLKSGNRGTGIILETNC